MEHGDQKEQQLTRVKSHTSGVGTQAYSSPEQLKDGFIDYKSDMYSLGIILYELYDNNIVEFPLDPPESTIRSCFKLTGSENNLMMIPPKHSISFVAPAKTM